MSIPCIAPCARMPQWLAIEKSSSAAALLLAPAAGRGRFGFFLPKSICLTRMHPQKAKVEYMQNMNKLPAAFSITSSDAVLSALCFASQLCGNSDVICLPPKCTARPTGSTNRPQIHVKKNQK